MAGLHGPLPTLRPWPRGQTRTARGRRGSLLLRRIGLSPTTPGRSPGALPKLTAGDPLVLLILSICAGAAISVPSANAQPSYPNLPGATSRPIVNHAVVPPGSYGRPPSYGK